MSPFVSRRQWRAMHARHGHRGWVKRWAKKGEGRYRRLPARKRSRK